MSVIVRFILPSDTKFYRSPYNVTTSRQFGKETDRHGEGSGRTLKLFVAMYQTFCLLTSLFKKISVNNLNINQH